METLLPEDIKGWAMLSILLFFAFFGNIALAMYLRNLDKKDTEDSEGQEMGPELEHREPF